MNLSHKDCKGTVVVEIPLKVVLSITVGSQGEIIGSQGEVKDYDTKATRLLCNQCGKELTEKDIVASCQFCGKEIDISTSCCTSGGDVLCKKHMEEYVPNSSRKYKIKFGSIKL